MDTTVVFYTANVEDETLEQQIRDTILKNSGGLPIISVSRKPIDFGENICIGEQPVNYANLNRQLLVGLKAARTRFVLAAEADTLYPPEYFTFTPPAIDQVYHYRNIWTLYTWPSVRFYGKYWKKLMTCAARMCGREYWIEAIEKLLDPNDWQGPVADRSVFPDILNPRLTWTSDNPVITCKTTQNLTRFTPKQNITASDLPFWGTAENLLKQLGAAQWIH
jgi:hypothetical protein